MITGTCMNHATGILSLVAVLYNKLKKLADCKAI